MPAPSYSRAQASVETLLVFIIFLSALGISYAAGSRLASAAQSRLDTSLSQSSFLEFSAKLQSACSLGNGNVREVEAKGKMATLKLAEDEAEQASAAPGSTGSSIIFIAGNFSARANSSCAISLASGAPARFFRIENRGGVLEIT
ncbi:MAG: hypothetical protein NTX79_02965 [Candidatus Micrarchaeota archaeon]|nr:hypothetical protein [Candidatus Micrarchaeota archaeon]